MPEHTFTASETDAFGVRVTTAIVVPAGSDWENFRDLGELAQSATFQCMTRVANFRNHAKNLDQECPF